jgi:hypothetical protein
MKKIGALTAAILLVAPLALRAQTSDQSEGYYDRSFARITYVKGDVSVQRASDQGFERGEVNLPLVQGDKLGTKGGRTEIHLGRSNYLRLDADTQLDFSRLPQRDGDPVGLHLLAGRIYLRVASLDRAKAIEVHTPDASFYVLDGGLYRFEVSPSRETEVFVLDGALEAAGQEGSVEVDRNGRLVAVDGELRSRDDGYGAVRDDFSEWNADRDEVHRPRASTRYLPREIDEYQDELDTYGRWTYEQPYGYVWVPSVYESDWRPYYHGRWVWYPIIGWTWVSYEPWGWAAYHYGRWHWRLGLGWYWIPTRHWGPAWVHWWSDYDYCGWCPLGWYDRPIIIVNNHFYHHDDGRDYPRDSRALTVVRRDQLQSREISRAALRADRISSISRVSLKARQPEIRPVVDRSSLDQREGAKILSRESVRGVARSFAPGEVRRDLPRLSEARVLKGEERSLTPRALSPREFKTYPSRRLDGSTSRSIRSFSRDREGGDEGRSALAPRGAIKSYPARPESTLSERSRLGERRDQPSLSRAAQPREFESRLLRRETDSPEPRSSSGSLGEILRTFRSRLAGVEPRSGDANPDSGDDFAPRIRSFDTPERRLTERYDDDSDEPRSLRSYDPPSRESSSPSSSYSSRSRESSFSSSRSGLSSRSSSSRSSSGSRPSSPSRSSGSSSRSGSSGRIRKK